MHESVGVYVAAAVADHGPFASVCEVGSRDINGGVRHLFGDVHYVGVDLHPGKDVDVVADFADWDTDERFDCVVTTSALEHTARAAEIICKAADILNRPGVLIVTCAGPGWQPHSLHDGGPNLHPDEHYENVPVDTLISWLAAAEFDGWTAERGEAYADTFCVAWVR